MDKINELPLGEKVIGGSGILLLLFSFFTWFKKDYNAGVVSGTYNGHNGWGGFLSVIGILLAIALIVVIVLKTFTSTQLPDKLGSLSWAQVFLIAGGATFVLVALQVLIGQKVAGQTLDRSIWAWLGLLAAAGVGAGSFLTFQAGQKSGGASAGPPPLA